jgi:ribosomal protein S6--L-glutamate ligase
MRLAILSRNSQLYSTRRLQAAAIERGHKVKIIDPLRCYMNIAAKQPEIYYNSRRLLNFDAIIPRISSKNTFYGTAVVRQFEMMGVFSLNESVAISRSRDKLRALQLLSRKGIGLPTTGFASSPLDVKNLIKITQGAPLVIKLLEGTQGIGVMLAETATAAESVIDTFMGLKTPVLVQEYIQESAGSDIRCFVLGDKVIAAMQRTPENGNFRSNLHRGGSASLIEITPEERKMAINAARIIGLGVAGVDIIRSKRGSMVLEVNSSPGLEGIEGVSGLDIASMIIKFIENNARPHSNKTRGQG